MTTKTLARAIKNKKPAIIKEKGTPRYVVLDWDTYKEWQEQREEFLDELEDYRELHDPEIQEHIREGTKEYMAGKSRPAEQLLAELGLLRDKPRKTKKNSGKL
ncbi:MAG: hypothetical protein HY617_03270 [Candidatus Sungbacteria bacterium]|nr:hypothetical protein [Candidatus Sungbacteria bacterium]